MKSKKTLVKDKFDLISSVSKIVNETAWFSLKHSQHGYSDVISVHWYHDEDTLMRVRFLASVDVQDIENVIHYFVDNLSLIAVTEIRSNYYTADRSFRPEGLKAAELLPIFIEFEDRYNLEYKDKPIAFKFHERILKQLTRSHHQT